jgi:septum site-determining protein MinC
MAATGPNPSNIDYEPAGELKIGQVGIANLRVRTLDAAQLAAEMRDRVTRAPKLFARAAVVVDFGGLAKTPDLATARALLDALREAGVLPVALAYGTSDNDALAQQLGLPLLAKFRAQYESAGTQVGTASAASPLPAAIAAEAAPATAVPAKAAATSAKPVSGEPGLVQTTPVRSGQQVYADNRDLTVVTTVGAGAEVIADGSIHIYGALRGRALAGAQGNEKARIFCREFHAELVAIAGHYKVLEDIPKELRGKAVQIWLDKEELKIAALD